jgi:hypothetical protein
MSGSFKAERIAKLHAKAADIQAEVEHLKSDPGVQLDAVVQTYLDYHENVSYTEAMHRVLSNPGNADLARRYRASFPNAEEKDARVRRG